MTMKFGWPWKRNQEQIYCDCTVGECRGDVMGRCALRQVRNTRFFKLNDDLWHHLEVRDGSLYYDGMEMIVALDQAQFEGSPGQQEAASEAARHAIDTANRRNN